MGTLVLDVAFDNAVPRKQSGFLDLVEDGLGIVEVVDLGVAVRR